MTHIGSQNEVSPTARSRSRARSRSTRERRTRRRRRFASALALLLAAFVAVNLVVTHAADGLAFDGPTSVPERPVAIVFGAGVVNGEPTPALVDRIDGAVALYKAGRVSHLLMSGDHSSAAYDEVTVMRDRAIEAGVPAPAISRDHAGLNTYDSCFRAKAIFGVRSAVLVTQDYHLSRALFTCRQLGIDAVGLRVADWQHHPEQLDFEYPLGMQISYTAREWVARAKAVIDTVVVRPQPKLLGPYEGLRNT